MENNKLQRVADAPQEWGDRMEIAAFGKRLQLMLPGGAQLTDEENMALAQYAKITDANPFRGEIYAVKIRGKLAFIDGYKLLIRWAKRQCGFTTKDVEWDADKKKAMSVGQADIGYTVWLLRDDQKHLIREFVDLGASFQEAYGLVAQSASGVVLKDGDMTGLNRQTNQVYNIDPPKGWTWHDVARKRALKNAINIAYGSPSPKELARESWRVGDVETIAEDWDDVTGDMPPEVRKKVAYLTAKAREYKAESEELPVAKRQERQKERVRQMRGDGDDAIGENWEEVVEGQSEELPFTDDEPFITPDPSRTVPDTAAALDNYNYVGQSVHDNLSKGLVGKPLAQTTINDRWNLIQYAKRAIILKTANDERGKAIPIPARIEAIPEFVAMGDDKPSTITTAKDLLKQIVIDATAQGVILKDIDQIKIPDKD